jgi:uncharacterized membrane protein YdjX (TVP38/TMEM64 family)
MTGKITKSLLRLTLILLSLAICHSRSIPSSFANVRPNTRKALLDRTTVALSLRGGGGNKVSTTPNRTTKNHPSQNNPTLTPATAKKAVVLISTVTVFYGLWITRASWMTFFNKEKLLAKTLEILHHLNQQPKAISYTTYMLGMAVWEALGLSTIPVETASGMVFGWTGLYLSAIGKLIGAVAAFCLARYGFLAAFIQKQLSTNEVLKSLEDSAQAYPLGVTIMLKLSCFPETIKNYGAGLLFSIHLWMFTLATVVHGWTFTSLWTYLGVDTAKRLQDATIPVDGKLQFLLLLALINGIVVSPLAMAVWLKSIRTTKSSVSSKPSSKVPLRSGKK